MALRVVKEEKPENAWYSADFKRLEREHSGDVEKSVQQKRQDAYAQLIKRGFPTSTDENWRHTNVRPIAETPFVLHTEPLSQSVTAEKIGSILCPGIKTDRFVFVNGFFAESLSSPKAISKGLTFAPLAAIFAGKGDPKLRKIVTEKLGHLALPEDHAFVSLNTSFLQDGACVHVAKNEVVKEPIEIIHLAFSADDKPFVFYPRLLVVAEDGSEVSILKRFVTLDGQGTKEYFVNSVTEIYVGSNAKVNHVHLQEQSLKSSQVNYLKARQERDSQFHSSVFSLGGALVRNETNCILNGKGGECRLWGLYVGDEEQHIDNHTVIDHAQPNCFSDELYHGILAGKSKGVFHGKIMVRPDAQKTQALQKNRNLLLSKEASIDTKPQLEIFADDVRCTHGATVGQLDPEALFYLRARGISKNDAEKMLIQAFASDIVSRLSDGAAQVHLNRALLEKLSKID